jgi:hypothetical protein
MDFEWSRSVRLEGWQSRAAHLFPSRLQEEHQPGHTFFFPQDYIAGLQGWIFTTYLSLWSE